MLFVRGFLFTAMSHAGKDDFAPLSDSVTLPSNARLGDMRCFDILIIGDNFIETDEVFRVTISTFFPDFVGDPSSATVTVTRDGDGMTIITFKGMKVNNDINYPLAVCSLLQNPANGAVVLNGNTVGSTATYTCSTPNFMLVGPETRECTANAGWSGQDPSCSKFSQLAQYYTIHHHCITLRAQM